MSARITYSLATSLTGRSSGRGGHCRVLWTLEPNASSGIVTATKTLEGICFANTVVQASKSLGLA